MKRRLYYCLFIVGNMNISDESLSESDKLLSDSDKSLS